MKSSAVIDPMLDLVAQRTWCRRLFEKSEGGGRPYFVIPDVAVDSSTADGVDKKGADRRLELKKIEAAGFEGSGDGLIVTDTAPALVTRAEKEGVDTLLLFHDEDRDHVELRRAVLQRFSGQVISMRLGQEVGHDPLRVLVLLGNGVHAAATLRTAQRLAGEDGVVTAAFVEPDIGLDASAVGERELERILRRASGGRGLDAVRREVVIAASVPQGVADLLERGQYEVVLVGATEKRGLGRRLKKSMAGQIGQKVAQANVARVRSAVPMSGRIQRWVESRVLQAVPQLERDDRIALVEKVRSNSRWDFDFFALMASSTVIAAIGLVKDSEAVVIGAMLVAPLMTPLLGTGMSIVHGNPVLARNALRSIVFGFLVAFSIGVLIGWCALDPAAPLPPTMLARGWPGVLDLVVAFVAGLAGAYATSRSSLMAALPGVAIAAALVPPIATAGLALSCGVGALSVGAAMLFVTNMVAIIFAAAICLWCVGLREFKPRSKLQTFFGMFALTVALGVGLWLSAAVPQRRPSVELRASIERRLAAGATYRVGMLDFEQGTRAGAPHHLVVQLIGGTAPPPAATITTLRTLVASHYGEDAPDLRVRWSWESR